MSFAIKIFPFIRLFVCYKKIVYVFLKFITCNNNNNCCHNPLYRIRLLLLFLLVVYQIHRTYHVCILHCTAYCTALPTATARPASVETPGIHIERPSSYQKEKIWNFKFKFIGICVRLFWFMLKTLTMSLMMGEEKEPKILQKILNCEFVLWGP